MKNRVAKERVIYSNYDVTEMYENAKQCIMENPDRESEEEPTEEEIWEEVGFLENEYWEETKFEMNKFFETKADKWILFGTIGRWNGLYSGGFVFESFEKMLSRATKDCDYIKLYDENGHLYLTCSHHDGTCNYEIKAITDKGVDYLERWEDNWNDKRSEEYVHNQIVKRYSKLPSYANKQWGCKRFEYEPITKSVLIDKLNNQAKSFYC